MRIIRKGRVIDVRPALGRALVKMGRFSLEAEQAKPAAEPKKESRRQYRRKDVVPEPVQPPAPVTIETKTDAPEPPVAAPPVVEDSDTDEQ